MRFPDGCRFRAQKDLADVCAVFVHSRQNGALRRYIFNGILAAYIDEKRIFGIRHSMAQMLLVPLHYVLSRIKCMLRVMVIDESTECAELLRKGLCDSGYEVVATLSSTVDILDRVEQTRPDVIVIRVDSPDRDSLENICVVSQNRPKPIVMFTQERDSNTIQAAVRAGVTAYIVDGLESSRVQAILDVAFARFNQFQSLQKELAQSKAEIDDRKQIERAKGLLMKQRLWDEDTAFRAIRKMAMDRNIKLADAAEQIIAVTKMLN